jgi:hypothetical protein
MPKPAVTLKLNGKSFCLKPTLPSISYILRFLDKQPADELFTSDELSKRAGVSTNTIKSIGNRDEFGAYSLRCGRLRYWGQPKAILALRAQFEAR